MATYFTADLHFGHANIIKHCDRPFSTVEEMDEHLITAWNSCVRQHDRIYIIGDFMFRNKESPVSYLSRLKGKKHLLLGNHDVKWTKKIDMLHHFETVERFIEMSDGQNRLTLCHYPLMSWNHMAKGSYMIHGHIHNNRNAHYFETLKNMPNLLNAGVDINKFLPVKLDELILNNESFKSCKIICEDKAPVALGSLSAEEFTVEIEKGYADMNEGKVRPASDVFADIQKDSFNAICKAQKAFSGAAERLGNPGEDEIQSWVNDVRYEECNNQ